MTATATITRSFNTVSLLNLLSLPCWIVDIVTGALWKFDRDNITVELESDSPSRSQKHSALTPGELHAAKGLGIKTMNGKTYITPDSTE